MKLWQFVVRRLLLLIPVLLGVTLITFALINAAGDPCRAYIRSEKMTDQQVDEARARHGCNEPVQIRYALYMQNLFQGDFGVTAHQTPVGDELAVFFPATLELTMIAMVLAVLAGIPIGVVSATRKDTLPDHLGRTFALSGVSIPIFWLALLLQMLMFIMSRSGLAALPISGRFDATLPITHPFLANRSLQPTGLLIVDSVLIGDFTAFWDLLAHILLPAIVLAYFSMAIITRMMRSSMLEVLRQDFVLTARSKGLPERAVIRRHARRNAMIPTVTVIGLSFGALLAGAVLTETVFAWPGVGKWSTDAIISGDTAIIMAFATVISLVYVFANLIVDVLYAYLDPRIRLE